jgi:hypothetical protein
MSLRVLRYQLDITDYQQVVMREPAKVVSVAQSRSNPNGVIDLWAIGGDEYQSRQVDIFIVGTGHPMPGFINFLGTVITPNGLVWHVWEGTS